MDRGTCPGSVVGRVIRLGFNRTQNRRWEKLLWGLTGELERNPCSILWLYSKLKEVLYSRQQVLVEFIYRQQGNYNRFASGQKRSPEHDSVDSLVCSELRGSAQFRAAAARVQRRKCTLVRAIAGADYKGNIGESLGKISLDTPDRKLRDVGSGLD